MKLVMVLSGRARLCVVRADHGGSATADPAAAAMLLGHMPGGDAAEQLPMRVLCDIWLTHTRQLIALSAAWQCSTAALMSAVCVKFVTWPCACQVQPCTTDVVQYQLLNLAAQPFWVCVASLLACS